MSNALFERITRTGFSNSLVTLFSKKFFISTMVRDMNFSTLATSKLSRQGRTEAPRVIIPLQNTVNFVVSQRSTAPAQIRTYFLHAKTLHFYQKLGKEFS